MTNRARGWLVASAAVAAVMAVGAPAHAQRGRAAGASPASQRPPSAATLQTYPPEQVKAGATLFASQCGFCHGRDAAGGEGGTDLTRSDLVVQDVRGDRIGPLVRSGRTDKGMPAFTLSQQDLTAIVAFIHDQQTQAQNNLGGRRSVDLADLQTGNADAGQKYFAASCTGCHSATGDLAGIASRLRGLPLLQRMLYPSGGRGGAQASAVVTLPGGGTVAGTLAYRDEFVIALTDADGWHRSWPITQVTRVAVDDPLEAHVAQLGKYTDADMHNVLAYLQTLR
jgi:cytochrome c oxidase cbb3-type subunit 3